MNSVSSCASSDGNDQVSWADFPFAFSCWDHGDVATVNQWVAQIPIVKIDGSVHGWDSHAVAVVSNPVDDSFHHSLGVQDSWWELIGGEVRVGKAKDIGVANRASTEAGSHWVTNDSTKSRVGSTVWFDGGWVVVSFHLDAHVLIFVEGDDACVIFEDTNAPVFVS